MKRRKHQAGKPGATADIEKPGLTVAFSHRGSPVHPGRDRLRVMATNPLPRLRFSDQPDHPVPAFQEFRMARQPINRFRRQLGAELSLKQITVFHVKHLRVSGVGASRETIAADRSHRTSRARLSLPNSGRRPHGRRRSLAAFGRQRVRRPAHPEDKDSCRRCVRPYCHRGFRKTPRGRRPPSTDILQSVAEARGEGSPAGWSQATAVEPPLPTPSRSAGDRSERQTPNSPRKRERPMGPLSSGLRGRRVQAATATPSSQSRRPEGRGPQRAGAKRLP